MTAIIQYWHQKDCPEIIRSRHSLWREAFPERYELFDREAAADFLYRHFGTEGVSGFRTCAAPAMASDYFRYHRLAAAGGLYVDSGFVPGDPLQLVRQTDYPLFALSVPEADLTPEIVRARLVLGRVLLNGVLRTRLGPCPWFALLARLVRRLIRERASQNIPMATGIGVLTTFDHATSGFRKDPEAAFKDIQLAVPPGHDRFLAIFQEFMADHRTEMGSLPACTSIPSDDMAALFHRPWEDGARFSDPAHWSNHRGSIFNQGPGDSDK